MKRRSVSVTLVVALAGITPCAFSSAAAQVAPRTAADCERLRSLTLDHTTISVAEQVSGTFTIPGARDTIGNLPALCRVAGEIRPTSDSRIAFEVWLPLTTWNGKLAGVGNGGWAGTITYSGPPIASLSDQVRRGYAVASTNTGHEGDGGEARFAFGHPERLADFGWRAVHEMTLKAKAVTQAFYGRPPQRAYWIGCSTGGKQALTEAQRFPEDYDGIIAGAPANNWAPLMTATAAQTLAAIGESASYLLGPARRLLYNAIMKACDALDGVEDRTLEDPRRCKFDPASLQCSTTHADSSCLTSVQVIAAKRIYAGPDDPANGRKISPGLSLGSELGWGAFATPDRPFAIPFSYYRWLVVADSTWDWRSFDLANPRFHQAWVDANRKFAPVLPATDPNLRAFRARGGKLIHYHGWNDQLITPQNSVDYYTSVIAFEASGRRDSAATLADVQGSYRLFMVPGMTHCGGGNGPNVFDMERALEDWVERGVAPDSVIAEHRTPNGVPDRRRPLCVFPKVAVYKGDGDSNVEASFTCRDQRP
jgi:feruloyl esterase